ncbi:PA2169 family four-helix-bundle protein [Polaribacter undariae]|uniref:PA2169 family four-helix-bundle protein n=1 Tax=Polaribacter sejongensis TaxID=985043 RepID=A0AAJ1VEC5_9FLAO|nr:PA2169 family four-helix-bundle protein [Polaribacter undariae]MDN3617876.1 PA2169 family four-helix-bundle protein [Polaribacter undariae]UWD32199.1 PA2169 family four-helix-bundle protein [Polaribacter undariae]
MNTYTDNIGNKLNALLEKTYDAEKGFTKAAENVTETPLKNYFKRKSQERLTFGHELKQELAAYGQDINKGGSITGQAHRTWMDIKSAFATNNEGAMLEEAIRGEKASVEEYQNIINETDLPLSTKTILESQKHTIESGLAKIKTSADIK